MLVPVVAGALVLAGCGTQPPASAPAALDGVAAKPEVSGEQYYQAMCSNCHGPDADGNGSLSALLRIPTPDLVGLAARAGGRFPRDDVRRSIDGSEAVAAHGDRSMPVWGGLLDPSDGTTPEGRESARRQIDAIVTYLESIQRAQ
jgi:mono/diheme cytochrome c family protein